MGRDFGDYLRGLRARQHFSLREVEREGGVSNSYLAQLERGDRMPSPDILRKLAPVYKVTVREMMEQAGYLEEPEVTVSEVERVERAFQYAVDDPEFRFGTRQPPEGLTLEAKRYIISIYEKVMRRKLL
ncbi:MAG: helix-turn-helix transcriptional regulator [Chloroflexota bacterium]|nr:helix-turn-helix transcriptional regulator [Chloroflexota bacterium]